MSLTFTILGCGSSGGVPRVGSGWGACDPTEPRNRRRRCSALVERTGPDGVTSVLIDTSPDLREQLLDQGVTRLDAVLFTHEHADHTHGIDDLRPLALHMRRLVPVYADEVTSRILRSRFGYCFETPPGSEYPPILDLLPLQAGRSVRIEGTGGSIEAAPFRLIHGSIDALGFRIGDLAYAPDVSAVPDESLGSFEDLDVLVLDALRYAPHPTHFSVTEALAFIAQVRPRRAVLTNLHSDLDYRRFAAEVPDGVEIAFDRMTINL